MEEAGADAHPSRVGTVGAVAGTWALDDSLRTGLWCASLAGAMPVGRATLRWNRRSAVGARQSNRREATVA